MKKFLCAVICLMLFILSAGAEIIPPKGAMQEGQNLPDGEVQEGVVLCESLSVWLDGPNGQKKAGHLKNGDIRLFSQGFDGCLRVLWKDGQIGWVKEDYVLLNPAFLVTEEETAVYAYGDEKAPRVALLDKGEKLPVILETEQYYVIALRGASGWVDKARFQQTENLKNSFSAGELPIYYAELTWIDENGTMHPISLKDENKLKQLGGLLKDGQAMAYTTKCPFGRVFLSLYAGETEYILDMAWDDCTVYRYKDTTYEYLTSKTGQGRSNQQLFELFDFDTGVLFK